MKEKGLTVLTVQARLGEAGVGKPPLFPIFAVFHDPASGFFDGLDVRTLVLRIQGPFVANGPNLLRRARGLGADKNETLFPIIGILRPSRLHEGRSANLAPRALFAGEETTIFHDPGRDGNPTSRIPIGGKKIVEEVSGWFNLTRMADDKEAHQIPPSEGG